MPQFPFKSYCWSIGTTSFRTIDFNVRIERQLALLSEFWNLTENTCKSWQDAQLSYYRFMQERNFVKGDAPNPSKDAREKTSGLADIGLIDSERRLTPVGAILLDISLRGNFNCDNPLQIPADSFIYLKQLLKTRYSVSGNIVRPFVVTAYVLLKLGHLTNNEFTYLLPLCVTHEDTEYIINAITDLRNGNGSVDKIIINRLMILDNYRAAQEYFLSTDVTEGVITTIGMNRKSGEAGKMSYDKPYYQFYELLLSVAIGRNENNVLKLYEQSKKLKGKPGVFWRRYLFKTASRRRLEYEGLLALNDISLFSVKSEHEFKRLFFEKIHLFKAKATLSDYADLNQRYFKITDTIVFANGIVEFDVFPRCWLHSVMDDLPKIAFSSAGNLTEDAEPQKIAPFLAVDEYKIYANLEKLYGITIVTAAEAKRVINDERYKRFNALIDERFDRNTLIEMFGKFERRDDEAIRKAVTNNADIPTIFEYILGIAWYLISDRCGDVLKYMNLSLEADLLPRTHAAGGNADIEYVYEQTSAYPAHTLLLEATLADSSNQRRMEMEPVSRHLGEHILATGDKNAYCIFVATFLHRNVVSDFRNRQTYKYYSNKYENVVDGLKILPIATQELKIILELGVDYKQLYNLLEFAYRSEEPIPTWYEKVITQKLMKA